MGGQEVLLRPGDVADLVPRPVVDALEQAPPAVAPSAGTIGSGGGRKSPSSADQAPSSSRRRAPSRHRRHPAVPQLPAPHLGGSAVDDRPPGPGEPGRTDQFRAADKAGHPLPASGLQFVKEWFTDGGFCSNFPVHLFDAALATRPTFAINLGRFSTGRGTHPATRPGTSSGPGTTARSSRRRRRSPRLARSPASGAPR